MSLERPIALKLADLAAIVGTVNDFDIKLFQNNVTPSEDLTLADLTEADFSGYVALTGQQFGAPAKNEEGVPEALSGLHMFTHSTGLVDNPIYGYWTENTGVLQFAERFADGPIQMQAGAAPIGLVLRMTLDGVQGDAVVIR